MQSFLFCKDKYTKKKKTALSFCSVCFMSCKQKDYDYGIRQVAGNDDYDDDYNNNEGRYLFFRLFAQGEEPPNTGGGRVLLPRCNLWSSGHC